ncbi:hypothetical protein pah_c004o091 [Parachlamydia acanthamoebae str. Hall's coccus]|nr:hypothetical protein pah_c004o091 [Parachlamydia acanthamoebae str. Hall's coccus]
MSIFFSSSKSFNYSTHHSFPKDAHPSKKTRTFFLVTGLVSLIGSSLLISSAVSTFKLGIVSCITIVGIIPGVSMILLGLGLLLAGVCGIALSLYFFKKSIRKIL